MAELTDTQIDEALARGAATRRMEPRATAVRYDRQAGRVIVELSNGRTFAFPARLAQRLEKAAMNSWPRSRYREPLDADLSVPSLLVGLFGTRAFMARQAGRATSPAKAAAARANGARGGRSRKSA